MGLSTKRIIIMSITIILIVIFMGLKTTTHWEYSIRMAFHTDTLYLYGFPIAVDGGFFQPVIRISVVGYHKYWLCGLTFITGAALFMGSKIKPLAELFNIFSRIFLVLAAAFMLFCFIIIVRGVGWGSLLSELFFLQGYRPIMMAFLPAVIFKLLSMYCKYKAV